MMPGEDAIAAVVIDIEDFAGNEVACHFGKTFREICCGG
jgi:hypothetical protein